MKNMRHGNFHFHHGDLIEFKKQGNLLLSLRDLEFVYSLLAILSLQEGKDEDYYWRKFNSDIQKVSLLKKALSEHCVEQVRLSFGNHPQVMQVQKFVAVFVTNGGRCLW